jgi:hypothetical protein
MRLIGRGSAKKMKPDARRQEAHEGEQGSVALVLVRRQQPMCRVAAEVQATWCRQDRDQGRETELTGKSAQDLRVGPLGEPRVSTLAAAASWRIGPVGSLSVAASEGGLKPSTH